jgi:hypothetical protein
MPYIDSTGMFPEKVAIIDSLTVPQLEQVGVHTKVFGGIKWVAVTDTLRALGLEGAEFNLRDIYSRWHMRKRRDDPVEDQLFDFGYRRPSPCMILSDIKQFLLDMPARYGVDLHAPAPFKRCPSQIVPPERTAMDPSKIGSVTASELKAMGVTMTSDEKWISILEAFILVGNRTSEQAADILTVQTKLHPQFRNMIRSFMLVPRRCTQESSVECMKLADLRRILCSAFGGRPLLPDIPDFSCNNDSSKDESYGIDDLTPASLKALGVAMSSDEQWVSVVDAIALVGGKSDDNARVLFDNRLKRSSEYASKMQKCSLVRHNKTRVSPVKCMKLPDLKDVLRDILQRREPESEEDAGVTASDSSSEPESEEEEPEPQPQLPANFHIATLTVSQLKQLGVHMTEDCQWISVYCTLRAMGLYGDGTRMKFSRFKSGAKCPAPKIKFGKGQPLPCLRFIDLKRFLLTMPGADGDSIRTQAAEAMCHSGVMTGDTEPEPEKEEEIQEPEPLPQIPANLHIATLTVPQLKQLGVHMTEDCQWISVYCTLRAMGIEVDKTMYSRFDRFLESAKCGLKELQFGKGHPKKCLRFDDLKKFLLTMPGAGGEKLRAQAAATTSAVNRGDIVIEGLVRRNRRTMDADTQQMIAQGTSAEERANLLQMAQPGLQEIQAEQNLLDRAEELGLADDDEDDDEDDDDGWSNFTAPRPAEPAPQPQPQPVPEYTLPPPQQHARPVSVPTLQVPSPSGFRTQGQIQADTFKIACDTTVEMKRVDLEVKRVDADLEMKRLDVQLEMKRVDLEMKRVEYTRALPAFGETQTQTRTSRDAPHSHQRRKIWEAKMDKKMYGRCEECDNATGALCFYVSVINPSILEQDTRFSPANTRVLCHDCGKAAKHKAVKCVVSRKRGILWLYRQGNRYEGSCQSCNRPLSVLGHFHRCHVVSVAHGGATCLENSITGCADCNLTAGTRNMEGFARGNGFRLGDPIMSKEKAASVYSSFVKGGRYLMQAASDMVNRLIC